MPYLDPRLVMEVGNIELLTGGMWQHLVVFLQDLVEALHRVRAS